MSKNNNNGKNNSGKGTVNSTDTKVETNETTQVNDGTTKEVNENNDNTLKTNIDEVKTDTGEGVDSKKDEELLNGDNSSQDIKPADSKPEVVELVKRKEEVNTDADIANLTADENVKVKLFKQCLSEFEEKVWCATNPSKVSIHYNKLHHAFRIIFTPDGLRGNAYKAAFSYLVGRITENPRGTYNHKILNANLDRIKNEQEREIFVIFINLVLKFALCTDRANFSRRYGNVDRLTKHIADEQLVNSIEECFLV